MTVIICPGIHPPELTQSFLARLDRQSGQDLVFPTDRYPAYSALHLYSFLRHQTVDLATKDILLIGFSAGVVGAVGAAGLWQILGGTVKAVIALDGWGVPRIGSFPMYRMSHDPFTHWSSSCLGGEAEGFYADPPVAHWELWRSPHTTKGWWLPARQAEQFTVKPNINPDINPGYRNTWTYTTATHFLQHLLQRYGEI